MKLRKLSLLIVSSALFAGAASASFAQPMSPEAPHHAHGTCKMHNDSAADVKTGLNNSRSQGYMYVSDSDYPKGMYQNTAQDSGKTRAQVMAELSDAQAKGLLDFTDSSYPFSLSAQNSPSPQEKTRTQVVAEINEARAQGLLSFNDSEYPKQNGSQIQSLGSAMNMASANSHQNHTC